MPTWGQSYTQIPTERQSPYRGPEEFRSLKGAIEARMRNEHTIWEDDTDGSANKDWFHRQGTAVAYWQPDGDAPQEYPNGNPLTEGAAGRLWVTSEEEEIDDSVYMASTQRDEDTETYVWNGTAWVPLMSGFRKWIKNYVDHQIDQLVEELKYHLNRGDAPSQHEFDFGDPQREVFTSTDQPTVGDGKDGDLWFIYD